MELLWNYGQAREQQENNDLLALVQAGVREGMTDVYVALKRLRRRGAGKRAGQQRQVGHTGAELERDIDRLALRFPERVH